MNLKLLYLFCRVALFEGLSYLFLLGIAMPLKYYADMPAFVKYGGWAHGILFVAYVVLLIGAALKYDWKISKTGWIFVASLIPFAPFFVEWKLKKDALQQVASKY